LLKCSVCGASYIAVTKDHVAYSAHRNRGTCDDDRTMSMHEIEQRVLTVLKRRRMDFQERKLCRQAARFNQ
jgi:hypothetical protein